MSTVRVQLGDQDQIIYRFDENQKIHLEVSGCKKLMETIAKTVQAHSKNVLLWPLPETSDHVSMLVRELILKVKNKWKTNKDLNIEDELCHCRKVSFETVDKCIAKGFSKVSSIRRLTSANTACGTCLLEVESLIKERLKIKID